MQTVCIMRLAIAGILITKQIDHKANKKVEINNKGHKAAFDNSIVKTLSPDIK